MKRILIVTSFFPRVGKETYLMDELDILIAKSEVSLLPIHHLKFNAVNKKYHTFLLKFHWNIYTLILVLFSAIIKVRTLQKVYLSLLLNGIQINNLLKLVFLTPKALAAAHVMEKSFTHIHAYSTSSVWSFCYLLSKVTKVPLSTVYHSSYLLENLSLRKYNAFIINESMAVRAVGRRVYNSALVVSPLSRNLYYLPLGCTIHTFTKMALATRFRTRRFLVVGVLQPHKGHLGILHMLKIYNNQNLANPLYVDIIGSGFMLPLLQERVRELNLDDYVHLRGQMHKEDIYNLFWDNNYAFVVSNSISYFQIHEGVPFSLIEAMSFGLPAVLSGCGGSFELGYNDANLVFHEGDMDSLLESFIYLDDYNNYCAHSYRSFELAKTRFNAENSVFEFLQMIKH